MTQLFSSLIDKLSNLASDVRTSVVALALLAFSILSAWLRVDWATVLQDPRYDSFSLGVPHAVWSGVFVLAVILMIGRTFQERLNERLLGGLFAAALVLAALVNVSQAAPRSWLSGFFAIRGGAIESIFDATWYRSHRIYRPYFTYLFIARNMRGKTIFVFENDFVDEFFLKTVGEVQVVSGSPRPRELSAEQFDTLTARDSLLLVNESKRGYLVELYFVEPSPRFGHQEYSLMTFTGPRVSADPTQGRILDTIKTRYLFVPSGLLTEG